MLLYGYVGDDVKADRIMGGCNQKLCKCKYIHVYCIEYMLLAVSIRSAFEFQSGETVDYWSLSTIVARLL